jgi:hypothetical protein
MKKFLSLGRVGLVIYLCVTVNHLPATPLSNVMTPPPPFPHTSASIFSIRLHSTMGIRKLYSLLSPYSVPKQFKHSDPQSSLLYIDGPGLCHYIYNILLVSSQKRQRGNAFAATISYRDFTSGVGNYLTQLQNCGFEM